MPNMTTPIGRQVMVNPTETDAVQTLAAITATATVNALDLDDAEAESFLPILIELLPVLADLLARNCKPEDAAGLRMLALNSGIRGRLFRWQYRNALRRVIVDRADYDEWGHAMGQTLLLVATNPEHADLVSAAMQAAPVPIWGVYQP